MVIIIIIFGGNFRPVDESEMPVMDWDDTHLNAPGVAESFVRLKQE